jgi:hypothetical protein
MPIFQDDFGGDRGTPPLKKLSSPPLLGLPLERNTVTRRASEESIRTDLCEGPIPDSPGGHSESPPRDSQTGFSFSIHETSNRVELIERLKRGQTSTWLPNLNVSFSSDS